MKNTEFYKEFYFKEIERRNELNNAVNLPILIISGIVSIHVYFYSQLKSDEILLAFVILSSCTFLCGLHSLFYLARSFSNFFRNHDYQELANMNSFLEYEKQLLESHNEVEALRIYKDHLDSEIANCHTVNFAVNIKRTEDIAKSKKGIFSAIILTLAFTMMYIIFSYLNMEKKEESKKTEPIKKEQTVTHKMETKTLGPKSVTVKCCVIKKENKPGKK
jgi:multisubunit Na+/H+ antiporter MnhB subunit